MLWVVVDDGIATLDKYFWVYIFLSVGFIAIGVVVGFGGLQVWMSVFVF